MLKKLSSSVMTGVRGNGLTCDVELMLRTAIARPDK